MAQHDERKTGAAERALSCPSSDVGQPDARVFGVVVGSADKPEIAYLEEPAAVTPELLALTEGLPAGEVFRVTGRCVEGRCGYFDGQRCSLGTHIAQSTPQAVDALPPCSIRADCRWFRENHVAACLRCPHVVTLSRAPEARTVATTGQRRRLRVV